MGAWSHEPFGNDTANDWAYELEGATDLAPIEQALDKVLAVGTEYLEAPEAEEAIAAIEVLAKLLGKGTQSDAYTQKVDAWVKTISSEPSTALLEKGKRVLQRVTSVDSELFELWEEEGGNSWKESIGSLRSAISA